MVVTGVIEIPIDLSNFLADTSYTPTITSVRVQTRYEDKEDLIKPLVV
jgi:hypothetical protein